MLTIYKNPNTGVTSIGILMAGYFGVDKETNKDKDGVKLADSNIVFPIEMCEVVGQVPIEAKPTLQKVETKTDEKQKPPHLFKKGQSGNPNGRPKGSYKRNHITEALKELIKEKHYKLKDTGEMVVAYDIIAEKILDKAVAGDFKYIELVLDRSEGKVTQGVRMTGVIATGEPSDEEWKKLMRLFPNE